LVGTDLSTKETARWIYCPEESTIFHRIGFPCNFSPCKAPSCCSSIRMEIGEPAYRPCNCETLVQQALENLVQMAIPKERDARPVSVGGRARVAEVVTFNLAHIIYDLKHRENTRATREYLRCFGIISKGRFGEWEYLNMDDVILGGKSAAEEIMG
jgi:protoporphyrinogen oxidase